MEREGAGEKGKGSEGGERIGEWRVGGALSHMDLALVLPQNVLRFQEEACAGAFVNNPVRTK